MKDLGLWIGVGLIMSGASLLCGVLGYLVATELWPTLPPIGRFALVGSTMLVVGGLILVGSAPKLPRRLDVKDEP